MTRSDELKQRVGVLNALIASNDMVGLQREAAALMVRVAQINEDAQDTQSSQPTQPKQLTAGDRIGQFRIESYLGEGGMGMVYLAVRDDNLDMKVALKTLGQWPARLLDLFRAECKILSGLKHPGIAHLIDAGVTDTGRPWMAMEYVDGLPLDLYLAQQDPDLDSRLHLFTQICDAVSHAHGRLIIHSDLKPGNILVTPEGKPKLLDFGIASLIDPDTGAQLTATLHLDRRMTPAYAAPEQFNGERLSTASDVYSLGVLLYEMLTGMKPYVLNPHNPLQVFQQINQAQITRPSNAVDPNGEVDNRFGQRLRGDLDTIVLKAMERDPNRRFISVEALAADLRLYRSGMPITARPVTLLYRLRKFVNRNQWPVSLALSAVLFLIAFSGYAHLQSRRVAAERDQATAERLKSEAVTRFLVQLFEQVDPDEAGHGEVTALQIMEDGRARMDQMLADQPGVQSDLLDVMGRVYRALGKYDTAVDLQTRALALETDTKVLPVLELIQTLQDAGKYTQSQGRLDALITPMQSIKDPQLLAEYYLRLGVQYLLRGRYQDADHTFNAAMDVGYLDPVFQLELLTARADLFVQKGRFDKALEAMTQILEGQRALCGDINSQVADVLLDMAHVHMRRGDFPAADRVHGRVQAIYEQLYAEDHIKWADLWTSTALAFHGQSNFKKAEPLYVKALELREAQAGKQHPKNVDTLNYMADMMMNLRRLEEAEQLFRQAISYVQQRHGVNHPDYAVLLSGLGTTYYIWGKHDKAESIFRQAGEVGRNTLGDHHIEYAAILNNTALVMKAQGKWETAEQLYLRCLAISNSSMGRVNPNSFHTLGNLGGLYFRMGRMQDALDYYNKALKIGEELTPGHFSEGLTYFNIATVHRVHNAYEPALLNALKAHEIWQNLDLADHPDFARVSSMLADLYHIKGDIPAAKQHMEAALTIMNKRFTKTNSGRLNADSIHGAILAADGRFEEAATLLRDSYEQLHKKNGAEDWQTKAAWTRLNSAYEKVGRVGEAAALKLDP